VSEFEAILDATDLTKSYRRGPEEIHALVGAEIRVAAGEVVALVGPSGSGKTTLLTILAGWERPDQGRISWRGRALSRPQDLPWDEVAIVPQTLGLVEELTVRENVALPVRLYAGQAEPDRERVDRLLADFGLSGLADRLPGEVSLGEQQRGALARSLVLSPRLLMADEPTGHQDVVWTRGVLRALQAAAREGTACLIATHHRALVRFADRVLAIRDGELHAALPEEVVAAGDEL
jgi:putative ABC transport system ATP-binding protein